MFNKEEERRALILISSYFLNVKEIKGKTILFIIVLKPLFIAEN
jgi:dolichol kinase